MTRALFLLVTLFAGVNTLAQQRVQTGTLQSAACNETSGAAVSALHPDVLYIHNDSGDTSRFFAVSKKGKLLSTCYFDGDPYYPRGVKDCEDIAIGPGPDTTARYIYLADIGDNLRIRYYVTVFRFREPTVVQKTAHLERQAVHLKYPDGPHDAEALLVDPLSRSMYIVTKREETVHVYSAPADFRDGDTVVLAQKGVLNLAGDRPAKWVVSIDVSRDGSQVLLKELTKVLYWKRRPGEPLENTLNRPAIEMPYAPEKQGEAIAFAPDGNGYYTIGEGKNASIYFYKFP